MEPIPKSSENLTVIDLTAEEDKKQEDTTGEKAIILKQQQQRLLLLRHAKYCTALPGKCQATQHCVQMKEIWEHIKYCKKQKCEFPHCVSSRYCLSHYHTCKNDQCRVCAPVKEVIAKSASKSSSS